MLNSFFSLNIGYRFFIINYIESFSWFLTLVLLFFTWIFNFVNFILLSFLSSNDYINNFLSSLSSFL